MVVIIANLVASELFKTSWLKLIVIPVPLDISNHSQENQHASLVPLDFFKKKLLKHLV